MKIVRWSPDLTLPNHPRVAALGAFDGVHLGHARTIRVMRQIARRHGLEAVVLTFDPSPREFKNGERQPGWRLTTVDEQMYYLRRLGVDLAVLFEFPGEIHQVEAEDFVRRVLVGQLHVAHVAASETHHFGHKGAGDLALLRQLGEELGFEVETVPPLIIDGERVSSTRIRNLLLEGRVRTAGALLGRPYAICAHVVSGRGLGTELGFPTANLDIPPEKILPCDGVYAGLCGTVRQGDYQSLEQPRPAAINVGLAPTVRGDERVVEVHIIGRHCDLSGTCVKVEFLQRLRDEQKFADLKELSEQIRRDAQRAAAVAGEPPPEELRRFERDCAQDYLLRRGDRDG